MPDKTLAEMYDPEYVKILHNHLIRLNELLDLLNREERLSRFSNRESGADLIWTEINELQAQTDAQIREWKDKRNTDKYIRSL